uniref:Truncated envelope glycoprotein n=1 Tax=Human immunodeficiency virus type 1 TaxID=11676 RepID=A0A0H3YAH1_HV1|nr:truncated envelope glycoprotein [Human immunodeficiency virus 1]
MRVMKILKNWQQW